MTTNQMVDASPYMWIFGGVIFVGFFFYLLFMAVDSFGLSEQQGHAEVTDKYYQPPHTTYTMQNVAGKNLTLPHSVDGAYVLQLKLRSPEEDLTHAVITKTQYDTSKVGQQLKISYQKTRLLGKIQVTYINFK